MLFFRHVANGEILSISLLMEDVLSTGVQERAMKRALRETEEGEDGDTTTEGKVFIARQHSSRMRTARLPTVRVSVATTRCQCRRG